MDWLDRKRVLFEREPVIKGRRIFPVIQIDEKRNSTVKKYEKIICERKGTNKEIFRITLNDHNEMNAVTGKMRDELLEVLNDMSFDNDIRCLVINGLNEKAFSSGGDI